MFKNYESSGKHMICDFKGIQNTNLLNNMAGLKNKLKQICQDNDFQILQETEHQFTPQGCSILFLLSESHLSIHTFPEKNHMSFDIYTCRQYTNNDEYNKIYQYLLTELEGSDNSVCQILDRYF
jgi:S-adenosylmethionine decarboxylase